jgi:hypothetical protein
MDPNYCSIVRSAGSMKGSLNIKQITRTDEHVSGFGRVRKYTLQELHQRITTSSIIL